MINYVVVKTSDGTVYEASSAYVKGYEDSTEYAVGKCNEPFDPQFKWSVVDGVAYKGEAIPVDTAAIEAMEAEVAATQYQRDRASAYPPLAEQLDYIYHNGVDAWKTDMIDPIKAKYPKP